MAKPQRSRASRSRRPARTAAATPTTPSRAQPPKDRRRAIKGGGDPDGLASGAGIPPRGIDRKLVVAQLAKVRALCAALPEVSERPSHGGPGFFVGKNLFAYFLDNHHGDGRLALWCAAPDGAQAMLIDQSPDHYFVPPYVGHRGWVGVHLDRAPWNAIAMVLETAHQVRYQPSRAKRAKG